MGYKSDGTLEDLFPADYVDRASRDIVDNVADQFLDGVVRRTPVAQLPQAYHGDFPAWEEDRGGRVPGTLKEAWERGEIEDYGDGLRVEIINPDPIASHVEHDTAPHLIAVKKARILRFPSGPVFRYAPWVWHPGTQGKHMLRDTEVEIDVRFVEIAEYTLELQPESRF